MTERSTAFPHPAGPHPDPDLLLEFALDGAAAEPVGAHLGRCAVCRRELRELTDGIEAVLPAVPRTAPGPGFESRVLTRMGVPVTEPRAPEALEEPGPEAGAQDAAPSGPARRRRILLPLAAAAAGLLAGLGIAWGVLTGQQPSPQTSDEGPGPALILTEESEPIGEVTRAYGESGPVLVVAVGPDGDAEGAITCLVRLADGTVHEAGRWSLGEEGGTWVISDADPGVEEVILADEEGRSWATAEL